MSEFLCVPGGLTSTSACPCTCAWMLPFPDSRRHFLRGAIWGSVLFCIMINTVVTVTIMTHSTLLCLLLPSFSYFPVLFSIQLTNLL